MRPCLATFLLCALSGFGIGCTGTTCNSEPCSAHVNLEFSSAIEREGVYNFEVVSGDTTWTCRASIPAVEDDPCDAGLFVERKEITTTDGNAVNGRAGESIVGLVISGQVESLSVSVDDGNASLADTEFSPDYEGVEINGEGCGECPIADHQVPLTPEP